MKTLPIFEGKFENRETGELYQGISVLVYGILQDTLDELLKKFPEFKDYKKVLVEAISYGLYVISNE